MTREEAIEYNKNLKAYMSITDKQSEYKFLEENYVALDMAIKALEQEPTDAVQRTSNANKKHIENTLEDAISREDVLDEINRIGVKAFETYNDYSELFDFVDSLPPVSTEKTGRWILTIEDWNKWTCSKCGYYERTDIHVSLGWKYCPNCGAKMIEPKESEDKE